MPSPLTRQQLAQRIHLLLEREIDHLVLVERLLNDPLYARDVLLVCDALTGTALPGLAALFREASPPAADPLPTAVAPGPAAGHRPGTAHAATRTASPTQAPPQAPPLWRGRAVPGHAAQANAWGQDTSGFGLSQPAPLPQPATPSFGDRLALPESPLPGTSAAPGAAADGVAGTDPRAASAPAPERRRHWLDRWRKL